MTDLGIFNPIRDMIYNINITGAKHNINSDLITNGKAA